MTDFFTRCICYVASEITGTYVNPRLLSACVMEEDFPRSEVEWRILCNDSSKLKSLPWVESYQRLFGNTQFLAHQCHAHFNALTSGKAHFILFHDPLYPPLLREIPDPPFALNLIGDPCNLIDRDCTAVVGSRRATPSAVRCAFELGRELQKKGSMVVSGGAYGCDIAAHHGVLAACIEPCSAVAVLAGGLANIYPRGNTATLQHLIAAGGALVSERLWHSEAKKYFFPIRNRIIAGMCSRIIVVQAGQRSGAMLTANRALDYGREVIVYVSPNAGEPFSGNTELLLSGASGFYEVGNLLTGELIAINSQQENL